MLVVLVVLRCEDGGGIVMCARGGSGAREAWSRQRATAIDSYRELYLCRWRQTSQPDMATVSMLVMRRQSRMKDGKVEEGCCVWRAVILTSGKVQPLKAAKSKPLHLCLLFCLKTVGVVAKAWKVLVGPHMKSLIQGTGKVHGRL
jgi:hypothetical protein